uniref:Fibronectin type-III domain-containing protein n=1 Tax=Amphimedon queenslandica TaxID=400682 RepID=A0A1X7TVX0_AMPQE
MYMFTVYLSVPLITPPVSVVPVIDGQLISLNISIDVSELCVGEYPNNTTVNILNINNKIQDSTSIPTQVNDQLMITGVITVPNNLNTFIVNVSLSNNGGEYLPTPSFGFGKVGPVTNIDSSIDNCSTIDITWTAPTVDDRVSILYYTLRIYDAITDITVQPVSINTTLNSTVVFSCEAVANGLTVQVNNVSATDGPVINKGFSVTSSTSGGNRSAALQAIAYDHNNNTEVRCVAVTYDPPQIVRSDTAILMIQGLLASVVDLDYTFINGSSVLLTWTAPYTLDNVPITGYYIVNGLVNITTTNKSIILSATNPDPCILNNVSVSPINDVGIGSSNNISFYYERVPLITPPVSVVPVIDGQLISLNISIDVSELCTGEYPNNTTVNILNIINEIQDSTSIPTQVNDQLMITGVITVPNNLNTFIVNVSLSNNGGEYLPTPSFGFGKVGPVTNINSSIDNCSTIDITWTAPTVDDRVSILRYILRIYDAITGSLVDTVSVYNTSYQFVDNNLFIHHYTYVITGVNELGEGISNNDTFSYQRVPRSVEEAASDIITYHQNTAIASFNIPITLECTGESPENVTVTIQCNGTGVVYDDTTLVEYAKEPMNITGSVPTPLNEQCNISIVFSNEAGSSEPFILAFDTIPIINPTPPPTSTNTTATPSPIITRPVVIGAIAGGSIAVLLIIIILIVGMGIYYKKGKKKKGQLLPERVQFDGGSARTSVSTYTSEHGTYSEAQTETTLVPEDDTVPMSYDTAPVEASAAIPGGSEVMAKQVNRKEKQPKSSTSKKETTGAIGGGAAKEPIYSDLGVAPPTGTKALPQTEVASVKYADIELVRPKLKVPPAQSYDDVVVSTASGTTVIGATGGDTNPPPIPDKKSKGATTTGQEGTNGGNDAARNLPHHVNDVYTIDNTTWTLITSNDPTPYDNSTDETISHTIVSGTFSSAQLMDDGLYQCNVSLYGRNRLYNTTLHVIVPPVIISSPPPKVLAFGPNITNYTVTFTSTSPTGRTIVTWYKGNSPVLQETVNTTSGIGSASIPVSMRSDSGSYRVRVKTDFGDQLVYVPQSILLVSETSYSFDIDVIVFPSHPVISATPSSFSSTIHWVHTNQSLDDLPESIKLVLLLDGMLIHSVNISINDTLLNSFTFVNLIPATQYSVRLIVANRDRISSSSLLTNFTTLSSVPSINSLSAVRVSSLLFNITLHFNYYGGRSINDIKLGYKSIEGANNHYIFIDNLDWKRQGLTHTALVSINDTSILRERIILFVRVTNSNGKSADSNTIQEYIKPLGPPSPVSFHSISTDSVILAVQLPLIGSPPILSLSVSLSSFRHNHSLLINDRIYSLGEELVIFSNESSNGGGPLMSGTTYNVTISAANLLGWSQQSSLPVSFTTIIEESIPTATVAESSGLEVSLLIGIGLVPIVCCAAVIIIIISCACCSMKKKNCKEIPKNGYAVTPVAGSIPSNHNNDVQIQKFFSTPLVPRPPTTEPADTSAYDSVHDIDTDSDTTQSLSPKYKYVISPTPSEIGIKGYVSSVPGSGTYIYV